VTTPELSAVIDAIMQRPGPVRLVAIDGPGGAGKSTLAQRMSAATGGAPVVHTDDFASADNPIDWWPRLLAQVIEPLSNGQPAHYQRYDWPSGSLAEWHTLDPAPIIVIEGVTAARREWRHQLSYVIWVETPRNERLRRGLERDGLDAVGFWGDWMTAEDEHYARDPTRPIADLVIDGTC
jgi:uridine kinase